MVKIIAAVNVIRRGFLIFFQFWDFEEGTGDDDGSVKLMKSQFQRWKARGTSKTFLFSFLVELRNWHVCVVSSQIWLHGQTRCPNAAYLCLSNLETRFSYHRQWHRGDYSFSLGISGWYYDSIFFMLDIMILFKTSFTRICCSVELFLSRDNTYKIN